MQVGLRFAGGDVDDLAGAIAAALNLGTRRGPHRYEEEEHRGDEQHHPDDEQPDPKWRQPPARRWFGRGRQVGHSGSLSHGSGPAGLVADLRPLCHARGPAVRDLRRLDRSDLLLALVAAAAAVAFFSSLGRLWPLADFDTQVPERELVERTRRLLAAAQIDLAGSAVASRLTVDDEALDYLQRTFGTPATQRMIRQGAPIYSYQTVAKRAGDPDAYWTEIHPAAGALGWGRTVQEDAAGGAPSTDQARALAAAAARSWLRTGEEWQARGETERQRPHRLDHQFVWERTLSADPELRERVAVTVSGDRVTQVEPSLVVPESARRQARRREAPTVALQTVGFGLAGLAALGAFAVFLTRLRAGTARLAAPAAVVAVIGAFYLTTQALETVRLLLEWDPLWPRWIATLRSLGMDAAFGAWILLVLFVVIAAGDALDRDTGGERGASLWALLSGRWSEPRVGLASLRGFLVGLVCGGVLTLTTELLARGAGGWSPLQPQGFFFAALNSASPAASTLLYFLMVALVEELAYRFFAGTWLLRLTGRRWLAAGAPAVIYGLTHTGLTFLPPAEPFWGRAVVFTAVGCVWGWAFLRYDALTVVLSHFSADLFIFNWPRLGSGHPAAVGLAVATMSVPLLPLLVAALGRVWRRPALGIERE